MLVTSELLDALHSRGILLARNAGPPASDRYCWLRTGAEITIRGEVEIEGPCGIYVGPYSPTIGGTGFSGLLSMGAFSYSYSALPEPMRVGRYCSISNGLRILDSHHPKHLITQSLVAFRPDNAIVKPYVTRDVLKRYPYSPRGGSYPTVGHDAWIGRDVTLSMNIEIGTGAVVAASSVVTKSVPPYAIVGGNPAQIIGWRFPPETIQRLLASRWWRYSPDVLTRFDMDKPDQFCEQLAQAEAAGEVGPFQPRRVRLGKEGILALD